MHLATFDQQDRASDYGSDFTPDEEEILRSLLQGAREQNNPLTDPDLLLKDIEDNEGPRGARLPPRLSQEEWIHQAPSLRISKARLAVENIRDESDITEESMLGVISSGNTD